VTGRSSQSKYDVIIIGGGNTALLTALQANEAGAKVLVLEKAPKQYRGGNGYFTTGIYRIVHNGIEDVKDLIPDLTDEERNLDIPAYSADDFFRDYMRITEDMPDPELTEVLISESTEAIRWMVKKQGLKMELTGLGLSRVDGRLVYNFNMPIQSKGGGAGLSDALYSKIEEKGIELLYDASATKLLVDDVSGRVCGVRVRNKGEMQEIKCKAAILACGGFESNPQWRAQYLGKGWDMVKVRGTRYNMGDGLRMALEIGAQPTGNWSGCHAIFIDADAPQPAIREDTEKTSRRTYNLGIIVNIDGKRFVDEGEDEIVFTYARFGQTVISQPQRIAFQVFDSKIQPILKTLSDYSGAPYTAGDTIEELADKLGIDPECFKQTVKEYNDASKPGGTLDPTRMAGLLQGENRQAQGILPLKSNWAYPMDKPPFYAYPVCCGITFTFGGIKINKRAQVLDNYDNPIPGLYASGEIVGGFFYNNYPGATGLCSGVVFGRIAGANAATD